MKIKKYNEYNLVLEKFDKNLKKELKRIGVTDENDIKLYLYNSHRGLLGQYLEKHDKKITFGLLYAIFRDALVAKKRSDLNVGAVKMITRILPIGMAPFFPIISILGYILGTSRAFNKVIMPLLNDPEKNYSDFLKKIIKGSMTIAEGEIKMKDRFTRAFVVSDGIVDMIKPEILRLFSIELSNKMMIEDLDKEVPEHYIENELKKYLNDNYNIDPKLPLREI